MIKREKANGFALVLSLVLLMVMSLMGGSLVVISSTDHKSNNSSDEYQQAFYVAETGLLEAEKDLINYFMGDWVKVEKEGVVSYERSTTKGIPPTNSAVPDTSTPCYKSFRNITKFGTDASNPSETMLVVKHIKGVSFYNLIEPILSNLSTSEATAQEIEREKKVLKNYTYEYFMVDIGKAPFTESGSSIASTSVDIVKEGTAYRIYACGIFQADDVVIPLESVIVLPG